MECCDDEKDHKAREAEDKYGLFADVNITVMVPAAHARLQL